MVKSRIKTMSNKDLNVAVVVLDTLRKDSFDSNFDWIPGKRYNNAWSTSHWTVPAHASLFTGRYGSELGVHGKAKHLDCPDQTFVERLQSNGWNTRGYSNNVHISHWFGFDRGFDELHHHRFGNNIGFNWAEFISEHRNEGPKRYLKLLRQVVDSDAPTLPVLKQGLHIKLKDLGIVDNKANDSGAKDTLSWIKDTPWQDGGEFLFINLMETHAPYDAPEEYQRVPPVTIDGPKASITGNPGADVEQLTTAYDDCVRYLSDIYKEIYDELEATFDVIVTLSDHGEAFGEYGGWEHFSALWPAVTHVPLVISTSDAVDEPVRTDSPVSLFDVYQTVCSYADLNPGKKSRGSPLQQDRISQNHHLIETHGMLEKARKRLSEEGFDDKILDMYDVELQGAAGAEGYSFENFDNEIINHNDGIENAAKIIAEMGARITPRRVDDDSSVPDHIEDQLKDLGYA